MKMIMNPNKVEAAVKYYLEDKMTFKEIGKNGISTMPIIIQIAEVLMTPEEKQRTKLIHSSLSPEDGPSVIIYDESDVPQEMKDQVRFLRHQE